MSSPSTSSSTSSVEGRRDPIRVTSSLVSAGLESVKRLQLALNFKGWEECPQFRTKLSLGRVALVASVLSVIWGMHVMWIMNQIIMTHGVLNSTTICISVIWPTYVVVLCTFHLAEFFVTALYNPTVLSSDSFMVNHSLAYTVAALISWAEFWIKSWLFPTNSFSASVSMVGLVLIVMGQICRTLAMKTCGESFNHVIQQSKKDSHVLITHGIYRFGRHPSYFGFFYWSIGTQLLLCNPISCCLYAGASWTFFHRRIPYEEATLMQHFPNEYPAYHASSYIGIPFLNLFPPNLSPTPNNTNNVPASSSSSTSTTSSRPLTADQHKRPSFQETGRL